MDSHKLDIAGKKDDDPIPTATYKQIPEEDVDDREPLAKNVVKSHNSTSEADGADEKMLPDEEKISPNVTAGDVKFTNKEKQNGDAKLDIGELKSTFVGMGKEELMKYANDPFWVRLRWTLFILFWLLWASMLVGAIVIIIGAPKCPRPEPRTWYEQGPLTEIDPTKITEDDLKLLKESGVKGVIADWPLDTYQGVQDSQEFGDLIKKAQSVELPVIVGLEPAHSMRFFNDSESKADAYLNYYYWENPKGPLENGSSSPPNNWLNPNDSTAWVYSSSRQQYYLAPFGKPQLNLRNPEVKKEFSKILNGFLDAGVKGIRINKAPYMFVDEKLKDEVMGDSMGNFTIGQYNFYNHDKTMNLNDLGVTLNEWKSAIKNKTEDGLLMISEDITSLDPYIFNGSVTVDLPSNSHVFTHPIVSASQLYRDMNLTMSLLRNKWPLWKVKNNTGLDPDVIDMMTFMFKGSTLIPFNYTVNKELLKRRTVPSLTHGTLDQFLVANQSVYAFIRVISGSPGYLVAINPSLEEVTVNFPKDTNGVVSDEVTVDLISSNYNVTDVKSPMKIKADAVKISPKAGIVLTYQPKPKEA
nr:neutral and basic amino acid transport protein rBAT isoform X2 [Onthophagus taurus]